MYYCGWSSWNISIIWIRILISPSWDYRSVNMLNFLEIVRPIPIININPNFHLCLASCVRSFSYFYHWSRLFSYPIKCKFSFMCARFVGVGNLNWVCVGNCLEFIWHEVLARFRVLNERKLVKPFLRLGLIMLVMLVLFHDVIHR